ncbi:MAG: amidohydrolase family protein [Nocardioidaceae bacterium]|nr:amidohydrolase family protein [Nocardioidaceae bacterium]
MTTGPARVLLRGGSVHSPAAQFATAMFTVDGRVAWIGDDAAASTYVDSADEIVDLDGGLVTPGFVDAHAHLAATGFALQSVDLGRSFSRSHALAEIESYARRHQRSVLYAHGWDETRWPDPRPMTITEVDRAVGDKVAYVARVDSHSAVISSALLAHDPAITTMHGWGGAGLVARDAHHAARAVTHALWTTADRRQAVRSALGQAASQGVTSVHELNAPHIAPFEDFAIIRELATETPGPDVVPYWGGMMGQEAPDDTPVGFAGDICVDGAVGSRTASMRAPYADAATSGHLYLDAQQVCDHVVFCTQRGVQAGFHVIGDRAVHEAVSGFEQAAGRVGVDALVRSRHRLEHVEMPDAAGMAAMGRLGIVASVQPAFDAEWGAAGGMYAQRLGAARAGSMNPYASMLRAGVILAFGSDSPVTPFAPWATVRAAAFHHNHDERLKVQTAFSAHTRGGHRARGRDEGGVLVAGAEATYAVWDTAGDLTGQPGQRVADRSGDAAVSTLPGLLPDAALPTCVRAVVRGTVVFDVAADAGVKERR